MSYEVSWMYWDEDDQKQCTFSRQFKTLTEATNEYEQMRRLSHIEHIRVVVILEECRR